MASLKVYQCFCCGSDVTVPSFFQGKVYGYTCIKKVDPTAKRVKDNGLWVAYQDLIVEKQADRDCWNYAVICNGKRFNIGHSYTEDQTKFKGIATGSKLFKIAEHANGCKPLYKSPVITTEQPSNGNHIVVSVLVNGLPA